MLSDLVNAYIALRTADTADHLHDQVLDLMTTVGIVSLPDLDLEIDLREAIMQALTAAYRAGLHDGNLRLADIVID